MKSTENLIKNHALRSSRQLEKQDVVLRFLRQHLWSSQEILQQVIGVSARQTAHKTLVNLEQKGYLRRYKFEALGGPVTIWGITPQGQAMAFNPEYEDVIGVYFEPSRVSEQTIRHQLDLQRLRLKAENFGWSDWLDGDRLGVIEMSDKRPDAIALDDLHNKVAIECERSFKSLKRYEQILVNYLKLIKAGKIKAVIWVSPNADISSRLQSMITTIRFVRVNGQKLAIDPAKHHANLYFCSYNNWPHYMNTKQLEKAVENV